MRNVPTEMTDAWLAEDKTGERRPTVRATIQFVSLNAFPYVDTESNNRRGAFRSILFGQAAEVIELPGIAKCSWSRGVTQDVAECTLILKNNEVVPIGQESPNANLYDDPGALTSTRGTIYDTNPWGFTVNGWEDVIVPDRLVRTYEGYGSDPDVFPAEDTHLKQSGTWLIDDVTLNAEGDIELKMRDIGRLLIDQIVFPSNPIPYNHYPLYWSTRKTIKHRTYQANGGAWRTPNGTVSSSGSFFIGQGVDTSDGSLYVDSSGVWGANKPSFALNSDDTKVWISHGSSTARPLSPKPWWQIHLTNIHTNIGGVRIEPVGGPYIVYVSVFDTVKQKWIGNKIVPESSAARTDGIDTGSKIPFVATRNIAADDPTDIIFPKIYNDISKVRITFRPGQSIGSDTLHPHRAGINQLWIYNGYTSQMSISKVTVNKVVGNIDDYTDAIKWMLGWAGFWWPDHDLDADYQILNDVGDKEYITYSGDDPVIPTGRIWGDFMDSGTSPVADLTADQFDKQPLMDCISNIRDILGFLCWVDETGGFVWRMPNIWTPGNYMSPDDLEPRDKSYTYDWITIDDEAQILSYSTTMSSRNLRERVFVGNVDGRYATVVEGYGYESGVDFLRIAGYLDQNFASQAEVNVMADMIATQQKFSFRQASLTIPGYPAIQIDDQIRIFERTTNETFFHYVETISSDLDMTNGEWNYQIGTHWLGEETADSWVVNAQSLTADLYGYLTQLGMI